MKKMGCATRMLAALMFCSAIQKDSIQSYSVDFEKTKMKGMPGHYDRMKHMSRKKRKLMKEKRRVKK